MLDMVTYTGAQLSYKKYTRLGKEERANLAKNVDRLDCKSQ